MSSHWKGTKREKRALDVWVKLARASETVGARLAAKLAEKGIGHTQLGVLDALFHLGPMPIAELGAKLLRSAPNMTAAIDRLEEQKLVERVRDETDRRVVRVGLPDEGRRLSETILPAHVGEVAEAMSVLTAEEQETLASLCRKLGLGVAASRGGGATGADEGPRKPRRKS